MDGAILYLLDTATGRLRFTHDAGIYSIGPDQRIRNQELPVGVGPVRAGSVADRRVVVTGDDDAGPLVRARAMIPGPVRRGGRPPVPRRRAAGGWATPPSAPLGRSPTQAEAFAAPQVVPAGRLADHAALAIANARLIDELARSQEALARQADVERSLRELGTRISGAREPAAVVQGTIDEALRLLDGGGGPDRHRRSRGPPAARPVLRGRRQAHRPRGNGLDDPDDTLDTGASGRAVVHRGDRPSSVTTSRTR